MNFRFAYSAAVVLVIMGGAVSVAQAQRPSARDGGLMPPDTHGQITVAGCLLRGEQVGSDDNDDYVLARPTIGLDSVPDSACSADDTSDALEIDHTKALGLRDPALLGHWIEVSGDLEKEMSKKPNNLRELKAHSYRLVPVVVPRAAAAPYRPAPPIVQPQVMATPEPEVPIATTGEAPKMPKTASPVPAIGLIGLLSLAGALVVRSFRLREPN